jgi:hypothetical protein
MGRQAVQFFLSKSAESLLQPLVSKSAESLLHFGVKIDPDKGLNMRSHYG